MTSITGLYLIPVLFILDLFYPIYILAFLFAYMIGAFLHMLEDSCTKTGIAWNSPFSDTKLKGEISTGKDIKKPRYFLYYLGALTLAGFLFGSSNESIPLWQASTSLFVALVLGWLVFAKLVAKIKLER